MTNNPAAFGTEEKDHEAEGSATYDFGEIVHRSMVVRRILAQLESGLFGHEKGAFTGAVCQKIRRMELAMVRSPPRFARVQLKWSSRFAWIYRSADSGRSRMRTTRTKASSVPLQCLRRRP